MTIINPFNPNSVVAPNLFAGRSSQINIICKKIEQIKNNMPSCFFIYGERGIGKTALVKFIKYLSENKSKLYDLNCLTSYYSVEKDQEIGSVLQASLNKITDQMSEGLVEKISKRLGDVFKNGKFQLGAFGTNLEVDLSKGGSKEREITIKDQVVSILINLLKSITISNKQDEKSKQDEVISNDGIIIVIDEIHNLKNIESAASILRNIITTLDVEGAGKISFIIIGYKEDMEKFFSDNSSSRRTFDLVELEVMPDSEAQEILEKGFKEAGIEYDKDCLKKIEIAGGYPHSVQIIGHLLIENDEDNKIDQTDWGKVMYTAVMQLRRKEFATMYTFDKPLKVKDEILVLLAEENKPLYKKELVKKLNKNVYQYIPALKKSGAIKEDAEERVYLQSQLFRTAIRLDGMIRKEIRLDGMIRKAKKMENAKY